MKSLRTWCGFVFLAALAMPLVVLTTGSAQGGGDGDDGEDGLPGAFNTVVCVRLSELPITECDESNLDFVGFFRSLLTFERDGTLTESDNFPGALDGSFTFSEGHGNLRRARGRKTYVATFHKAHRPVPPFPLAVDNRFERVLLRFKADGDRIQGTFVLPASDSFPGLAGTFGGARIAVETF